MRHLPWAAMVPPLFAAGLVAAQDGRPHDHRHGHHQGGAIRADAHAPIGVMGDHMHEAGGWMLSYRFMRMSMDGNRIGTDGITPEEIATTIANPFAGPPTLRVVPTDMTMDMHMVGLMYGVTDWLTLMVMGLYLDKEMDHTTFAGPAGTDVAGTFTTRSSGFGDTRVAGLVRLYDDGVHHVHLNAGLSLPSGSIDETDDVLAPTGLRPTLTLPYPMQLGSGTVDLLPGITYTGFSGPVGWGAQYAGTVRLGDNDADYTLGDVHVGTAWASYLWADWISTSLRVRGQTVGRIDGQDARIAAPVQTAVPAFQGGERIDLAFGLNLAGQAAVTRGHRIAFEFGVPVYQDLNGPQLETDWTLTLGWQYAF